MSIAFPQSSQMLADILEQPIVARACLELAIEIPMHHQAIRQLQIVACGSSRHAGLVGARWFERWAGLPATVYDAADYADRVQTMPQFDAEKLIQFISQSGRTADVLAAVQAVQQRSRTLNPANIPHLIGLTNSQNTPLEHTVEAILQTPAGEEQAIAATKTFLAQLLVLMRLALNYGTIRQTLSQTERSQLLDAISHLPSQIQTTLELNLDRSKTIAEKLASAQHLVLLGQSMNIPIAREGALKLKETTYLHAEGYAASDFMHGPIAIVESGFPVILIASGNVTHYAAMIAAAKRLKSYGAYLIGIIDQDNAQDDFQTLLDDRLEIPAVREDLSPILTVLPLQLLACRLAQVRGLDTDRPRHLTKYIG